MERKSIITPRQQRLIASLLTERSQMQACKAAEVSASCFYRWLREDPAFVDALTTAQRETSAIVAGVIRRLACIAPKAINALEDALDDPLAKPGERTQAANVALTRLADLREKIEFDERMVEIEKRLDEYKK